MKKKTDLEIAAMRDLSWLAAGLATEFGPKQAIVTLVVAARGIAEEYGGSPEYVRKALERGEAAA